jgi:hypothetical protein
MGVFEAKSESLVRASELMYDSIQFILGKRALPMRRKTPKVTIALAAVHR